MDQMKEPGSISKKAHIVDIKRKGHVSDNNSKMYFLLQYMGSGLQMSPQNQNITANLCSESNIFIHIP